MITDKQKEYIYHLLQNRLPTIEATNILYSYNGEIEKIGKFNAIRLIDELRNSPLLISITDEQIKFRDMKIKENKERLDSHMELVKFARKNGVNKFGKITREKLLEKLHNAGIEIPNEYIYTTYYKEMTNDTTPINTI